MLFARGDVTLGAGTVRWTVGLAPRLWCCAYVQSGVVVDTRLIGASTEASRASSCVYIVLSGSLRSHAGAAWDAPAALVLSGDQLDGANGERGFTYTAVGDPLSVVEMNVWTKDLLVAPAVVPPTLRLGGAAWRAAADVHAERDEAIQGAIERLLRRLAEEQVLSTAAVASMLEPESPAAALLWRAFRPMAERLYLTPTLQEVGTLTGLSIRNVERYIRDFVGDFGLAGGSWRASTRYLRLRLAAILLTAEGVGVTEVALRVGYRSPDAMARAFRDAGMLPPTELQVRARTEARRAT